MTLNDVMWTFSKKIYESTEEFMIKCGNILTENGILMK